VATELPPAIAKFIADVTQYTEPLQKAIEATRSFGDKTDSASLKAREMGLRTMEAADQAAAAMKIATDAADKYARGEIDLAAAQRAAADAARSQARADVELAALQDAVAKATKRNADEQDNLKKKTEDASKTGFAEMSMLQKIWVVAGFATGSLEPLGAGLIAIVGGLSSGIVSAGMGLASFGLVAKSNLTTAATAAGAVQTAQTNYNRALAAGTKQAVAYKTEQAAIKTAYSQLNPAQIQLSKTIGNVKNEWQSFVQSNTTGVAKVMTQGIGLIPKIFSSMQMFMKPTETALSHIIGMMSRGMDSSGFAKFMKVMSQNAGPSIEKIAIAIGRLIGGFGSLMEAFAPFAQIVLSGLDKMTGGFAKWAAGLSKTVGFQEFMTMVKTQGPTIVGILKNLGTIAGQFIKDMSGSASNMLWLKVVPQITQLAAGFMKANPHLVEFAMNAMLVASTGKQLFGVLGKGVSAITTTTSNVSNLVKGFNNATKAADEATGAWGTTGGKLKSIMTGVPFKNFAKGFKDADAAASETTGTVGTFGGVVKKALSFPTTQLSNLKKGMNDAEFAASGASGVMGTLGGNITKMTTAIKGWSIWSTIAAAAQKIWTGIQWAFNAAMDAMPIFLVIAAIALLVGGIIYAYTHFKTFRDIVNDIGRALKTGFLFALHEVERGVKEVINFIKGHWVLLVGIILGPITFIAAMIYTHWNTIKHIFDEAWGFIKSVVKRGIDDVKAIIHWFASLPGLMRGWWNEAVSAVENAVSRLLNTARSIRSRVLSAIGDAGKWLWDTGIHVVEGLIGGIGSMAGKLKDKVTGLGHDVVGWAKDALSVFSPSKKFVEIGTQITAGLTLGINTTAQQAVDESRKLAREVIAAAMSGQITASEEKSLQASLSKALGIALKGGVQSNLATGTIAQIGAAHLKLLQTIWDAARGGLINTGKASSLATWVKADNVRLQELAKERTKIASEIAAAQQYAAGVTSSAESTYSLTAAAGSGTGGTLPTVNSIISALQGDASKIRKFKVNLTKLAKEGLNKAYLSQIIAMGPDQGGPLAAELAAANLDQIKQINAAEASISKASTYLGQSAADIMYDSGKQAGKGFLSGLKAQEAAINKIMQQIARNMVATLRRELGISSPSRVMMEHGMMVAEGLARGMESGTSRVTQAAAQLSNAVVTGNASLRSRSAVIGGGTQNITINLRNEITGKMNEREVWSALQQETFRYNIRNTGIVTGAVRPGALWRFLLLKRPRVLGQAHSARNRCHQGTPRATCLSQQLLSLLLRLFHRQHKSCQRRQSAIPLATGGG
jgi:hypothetical protein